MDIVITFFVAAIVGGIVYVVMSALEFLAPYARIGGVIAFLLVLLTRLSGRF